MADEKDFREPDGATQDYELDEVFELAFEIDAFLRAHNLKYRTKFPMEQRQREIPVSYTHLKSKDKRVSAKITQS